VAGLAGHVGGGADDVAEEHLAGRCFQARVEVRSIVCLKVWAVTGWFDGGEAQAGAD
jgi:hypothetical protein